MADACGFCGDGNVQTAHGESCETGESSATVCSRYTGTKPYYSQNGTVTWDFESATWPSWITATTSSWSQNSTYKYSGSYSYCSDTFVPGSTTYYNCMNSSQGSFTCDNQNANTKATLTLNVDSLIAGTVSFYIYGTSEKKHDYLTIKQNGTEVFTSKGTDHSSWTELSYSVSEGTTKFEFIYSKDSTNYAGIDRYCVDLLSAPTIVPKTSQSDNPSTMTCNSSCSFNSGTCYSGWCGDGIPNGPEFCDSGHEKQQ